MTTEQYIKIRQRLESFVHSVRPAPWQNYPKVKYLAKRYKVRQQDIQDMVEDSDCLDLIVGFKTYDGFGELKPGDYRVEPY